MKQCLLLYPIGFYSYSDTIISSLNEKGYDVKMINDEYPFNTFGKIIGTLDLQISKKITENVIKKKYLKNARYDLILIIKGRGVSSSLINEFKKSTNKVVAYNFDSFNFFKNPIKWFKYVDNYYTFDYNDANNFSLPIIELFSSFQKINTKKELKYNISFVGRNHSDRINFLNQIFSLVNKDNTFIYIFEKNILSFLWNFLKNPIAHLKFIEHIHFKPLSYSKYKSVLEKSNFTIDYSHPKQTGITIRCFEALSCKTKIVTNNTFVNENKNFNKNNTIVFDKEQFLNHYNLIKKITPKGYNRNINDFIDELIKL